MLTVNGARRSIPPPTECRMRRPHGGVREEGEEATSERDGEKAAGTRSLTDFAAFNDRVSRFLESDSRINDWRNLAPSLMCYTLALPVLQEQVFGVP